MQLTDKQIRELVSKHNLIENFVEKQKQVGVLSFGLDSCGYDFRIRPEYKYPKLDLSRTITKVDPKDPRLDIVLMAQSASGDGKIEINPNSFVRVSTIERFNMPNNVCARALGKSTYTRNGVFPVLAPIEPGFSGTLTFSVVNSTQYPAVIYANEGIAQIQFFLLDSDVEMSYADKGGKYMDSNGLTESKIKE